MGNPWTKRNPLLSMWMSGANAVMGATRAHLTAQTRRNAIAIGHANAKQIVDFWTAVATGQPTSHTRQRKRRS